MHIVHLCSSGRAGGVETSVCAMLESLRVLQPSWELTMIAPEQGAFLNRVQQIGCRGLALPFPASLARFGEVSADAGIGRARAAAGATAYGIRLRRLLTRLRPDVVHAHGIKMQVLSRWTVPRRSRLVWHVHDYVSGRGSSARALGAAKGRCAAVIANSRSVADDVRERIRMPAPIVVMHNAIDLDRFSPTGVRIDLDRLAGLPAAEPCTVRIGLPAMFGRWKGHDVFLRALSRLPREARWRGYVIGDAVYQTTGSQWSLDGLQGLVSQLGLSRHVGFTGLVDDMPAALRALDVVVHASTQPEPFGMSIAEAMSCGRPTIVAMAGGAAEIIHDMIDAVAYPPGDHVALASALASLVGDPAARARLGEEARHAATRAFDGRRLGPELVRVYESVLAAD